MQILIHDASCLIDLISVELLELALELPYRMEMPYLVQNEIRCATQYNVIQKMIDRQKLHVIRSSQNEINDIAELNNRIPKLSFADCSVLYHASLRCAIILSGDAQLRKTAEQQGIPVHGTLWFLKKLVDQAKLKTADAVVILERLNKINPRLPQPEIQRLLNSWQNQ